MFVAALVALSLVVHGCGERDESRDEVALGTVGGEVVSAEEFEAYSEFRRLRFEDVEARQQGIEQYLQRRRLVAAIEATGFHARPDVAAELQDVRASLLVSRYFDEYLSDVATEDDVRAYYDEHRDEFEERRVRVAHVFFSAASGADDSERTAKRTRARGALSALERGDAFADVAARMSDDRVTAQSGGDLGWVRAEDLPVAVAEQVFAMSPSSAPRLVESEFGFHVVAVVEGPSTISTSWATASANITSDLRARAREHELQRLIDSGSR